ncbi:hypothetical protein ACJMK2_044333 [Sinanodonta woodiana]|uniref:Tripartite motif-containing protein 2 n=1 Tax=Sinanodonta woodiana TaxID=1069815 RepID=A0ABD3W333_SINWO
MADAKTVDDSGFKPGVMSPTSKQKFRDNTLFSTPLAAVKKNIVLDEGQFEETFLKCYVCRERFNSDQRSARLLPCHHSFCLSCVLGFFKAEAEYRQSLTPELPDMPYAVNIACPICKGAFISSEEGIKQLAIDHRVVQLLDFVGSTEKQTINYCSKHNLLPLNFFCETCIKPVCRDCTVLQHKDVNNHRVFDIHGALQKYTPALDSAMKEMEGELKALTDKRESVEKVVSERNADYEELMTQIRQTFDKLRQALNDRENELVNMAESMAGKEKDTFEENFKQISEKENCLKENIKSLEKAKAAGNVQEMFEVYQSVREYKATPPIIIRELDDGPKTKYSFNGRDDKLLLSRIENFGDVSTQVERSYTSSSYSSSSSSSLSSSSYTSPRYDTNSRFRYRSIRY